MNIRVIVFILGVAAHSAAQNQPMRGARGQAQNEDNLDAYWNRGFGFSQQTETYHITLRVPDVEGVSGKIDAFMGTLGASRVSTNDFYNGQSKSRQSAYAMPSKSADKAAKRLMDYGELINYNLQKSNNQENLKQINERISKLEKELGDNEAAFARLPIANHFMQSRLNSLRAQRDVALSGANKSQISIHLQPEAVVKP